MKTIRIVLAVIILLYSGYLLINVVPVIHKLTDYGIGVLAGALVLLTVGILLLRGKPKKK
ncbi:MAG: hypothetical protein RBT57_01895 [Paludibacter sp.]|jgi:membrane protein DedA with SNARE-associated domain|nr:hypothetical protein [Paludibacter sp.]